jgi:hypothetical protein
MKIENLDPNITDSSAKEYGMQLVENLEDVLVTFDAHAMSAYYENFLQGKKEMLSDIIKYIKNTF